MALRVPALRPARPADADTPRRVTADGRPRRFGLFALVAALFLSTLALPGPAVATRPPVTAAETPAVESVGMTVADLDRSVAFYTTVLGFEAVSRTELAGDAWDRLDGVAGAQRRVARMRLGDESVELTEYVSPRGAPFPAGSHSNDLWFQHIAIIVSDMGRAHSVLRAHGVTPISPEPQRLPDWNPSAGGIEAFYFADPDGHPLELLSFPPDKGDPKWHRPAGRLFLGVDHTAIAVGDTDASLRFYRDTLGLRVAGRSENWGPEQARLNDVPGAHLLIISLRPAAGPAVEFLHYLAPRDGRPAPPDRRANDLVHRQTRVVVSDLDPLAGRLADEGFRLDSAGVVDLPVAEMGFRRAVIVRDPDGHAVQLVEP